MEARMRDYETLREIEPDVGAAFALYEVQRLVIEVRDGKATPVLLVTLLHRYP